MTTTRPISDKGALMTSQIPVQLKMAAAWTSFMFLYIYVDYFHLYMPDTVGKILQGQVFVFDVSAGLLTGMLASVTIPALMVVLSVALPAAANRWTNLLVATVYIPYSVFNAAGVTSDWAFFYVLSIGVEVLILAFILRSAWTWPRAQVGSSDPTLADRTQSPSHA